MYTKLTKVINLDGQECIACSKYGTDECHIHKGIAPDCSHCDMLAAIINQLHIFEEIFFEKGDDNQEK